MQEDEANMVVTRSHRIMVIRGTMLEAALASSLRVGDSIMCARGVARVASVQDFSMEVEGVSDRVPTR